ncbi:SDR family NAD(P)-dependent oxidoreductase [Roseibium suaedae]|uniref:Short-chain dehydrogenase n=1 Tax=Roseibium suaedae TaxID=735517 RepID=A0A1M7NJG5_9HYPH|nr:SDR family NAD(P)-dependent oxidoreductase [Roseibium suaedae]SHN03950.1 Short-chain dehydrogenase [Roseibium suaedae]
MNRMQQIVSPGSVAVITGAAKGIGAAIAEDLAARGMNLVLFDRDETALDTLAGNLETEALSLVGDVARMDDCERLHAEATARFGSPNLLINNAGMMRRFGPWASPEDWREALDVNFTSALRLQHLFVPGMLEADAPAAIVNLGSKEGITTPPGQAVYSVAKAGIKILTEQLEHELRNVSAGRVSAHLLVPGYTYTPMNFPEAKPGNRKPEAPWSARQMVDYFIARLLNGDFYILCPDNEVTATMDAKRIRWAADDMIRNRPALSRWHPDYKEDFAQWMKS